MASNQPIPRPPKLARRLLHWFCDPYLLEEIEGDLEEYFLLLCEKSSLRKANWIYWYYVLGFLRPHSMKKSQNSNKWIMINNYIKFSFRYISKHWASSLFNIGSLSVGIACFLFIFIYLSGEKSFDSHYEDTDRIRRVVKDFVFEGKVIPDATTPPALAPALAADLPEVERVTRIFPSWGGKFLIGTDRAHQYYEEEVFRVDPQFLDVFSYKIIAGNPSGMLSDPSNSVLTQSMARKYFGDENPIGQELTLFNDDNRKMIVSGVIEDVPHNSHFTFDFLMPIHFPDRNIDESWGWYNYYTYVKLQNGTDPGAFEEKLQPLYLKYNPADSISPPIFYSQALEDIHLKSSLKWELGANGSMSNIRIFEAVGIFILLISLINYLNLTIGGLIKRVKEVSVRKSFGAGRANLIGQFVVEAMLITLISVVVGGLIAELALTQMTDLFGRSMSLFDPDHIAPFFSIVGTVLFIGLFTGLYLAMHFSRLDEVNLHSGKGNKKSFDLRNGLLIIQFAISVVMIIGTLVVYEQLMLFKNSDMGFNKEQVLVVENADDVADQKVLMNQLNQLPFVKSTGLSNGIIGGINWTFSVGYPDDVLMNYALVTPDYLETMEFDLIQGRNFDESISSDAEGLTMIVNETALKELGISPDQIGQSVVLDNVQDSLIYGKIIGVVKDFHFSNFKSEIRPFAFLHRDRSLPNLMIRLSGTNLSQNIQQLENVWSDLTIGSPMESYFMDQSFEELHSNEERLAKVLLCLTILSIFIAFTGMLGIVNIAIKDRLNEIAVRKVLGAETQHVVHLLSKNFLLLVIIANAIGLPLAFWVMDAWISDFAYRITLSPLLFAAAGLVTLVLAYAIVGIRSYQAANGGLTTHLRER